MTTDFTGAPFPDEALEDAEVLEEVKTLEGVPFPGIPTGVNAAPVVVNVTPRDPSVEEGIAVRDRDILLAQFRAALDNDERFDLVKSQQGGNKPGGPVPAPHLMKGFLVAFVRLGYQGRATVATGIGWQTIARWKKNYDFFNEWYEVAQMMFVDLLEQIVDHRAFLGYEQPVYGRTGLLGYQRIFSDKLAEFRLRALAPRKYREKFVELDSGPPPESATDMKERLMLKLEDLTGHKLLPEAQEATNATGGSGREPLPQRVDPAAGAGA